MQSWRSGFKDHTKLFLTFFDVVRWHSVLSLATNGRLDWLSPCPKTPPLARIVTRLREQAWICYQNALLSWYFVKCRDIVPHVLFSFWHTPHVQWHALCRYSRAHTASIPERTRPRFHHIAVQRRRWPDKWDTREKRIQRMISLLVSMSTSLLST